jgi:hypothetical protein
MMSTGDFGGAVGVLGALLEASEAATEQTGNAKKMADSKARIDRLHFQRGTCLFALSQHGPEADVDIEKALRDLDYVLGPPHSARSDGGLAGLMNGLTTEPDSVHSILESLGQPVGSNRPGSGFPGQQQFGQQFGVGSDPFSPFGGNGAPQQPSRGITEREALIAHAIRGLLTSKLLSSSSFDPSNAVRTRFSAISDLEHFTSLHTIVFTPETADSGLSAFSGEPTNNNEASEKMEETGKRLLKDVRAELGKLGVEPRFQTGFQQEF